MHLIHCSVLIGNSLVVGFRVLKKEFFDLLSHKDKGFLEIFFEIGMG
jgi:hypothetical protein